MLDPSALRRAIATVEEAVDATHADPTQPDGDRKARGGKAALARLYAVYAHSVLNAHGVTVDLDDLCGGGCRDCVSGTCARHGPEPTPPPRR